MLNINGRTLIERSLDALDAAEITKCVIVVGYQKQNLIDFIGTRYKNIDITYVANDIYNKTNNIYSLYLAKEYLEADDTILLESDLIFEERIVRDMVNHPAQAAAAVALWEAWMDGTVVQLAPDKRIVSFIPGKYFNFADKQSYYKTVNIYKFSREFSRTQYVPFLEAYCKALGNNEYYEQVLRVIATLENCELYAHILSGEKWYEIDDAQDKDIAETIFAEDTETKTKLISRRFGGYWRFPGLLDFCYLVNPYFPTERMHNEIKSFFTTLITEYPSGLNTQNLLAGKLFNIDEENIITGNGAAELIRAVSPLVTGVAGVIYPTFNEYPESFTNAKIAPFYPRNAENGMRYNIDDLLEWQNNCDTLLLINPDNPTGNYVSKNDILKLLDTMKQKNKRLILDESFIDFSDAETDKSLLTQDILNNYPNLVILKSLSKSYGVPGIRLGILASGNKDIIQAARKNISIWNINSFAEYFLQIIGKYQKEYAASCAKIAAERARFSDALHTAGLFDVYPSQANYIFCRAKDFSAASLTQYLLAEHNIFIKDLTGKKGITGGAYIRLAVRNEADNNRLVMALAEFKKQKPFSSPPPPF
jgi:histidinol-phosphate/aromatic aminotransferase/cobyric acid decarboxylase-like protein/choline kinase